MAVRQEVGVVFRILKLSVNKFSLSKTSRWICLLTLASNSRIALLFAYLATCRMVALQLLDIGPGLLRTFGKIGYGDIPNPINLSVAML